MGKAGKIESHNLGPRILQLRTEEGKTSYEIEIALKADGFNISQATISRWIKQQRDAHKADVQDIVHDHVVKVVPQDMDALENMESKCLAWAEEEPDKKAERISNWQRVAVAVREVREMIVSMQPDTQSDVVKQLIDRVVKWIMEDINTQKHRINAMRMATSIIDTKLKFSGILDGHSGGNIFIGPTEDNGHPDDDTQDYGLHIVREGEGGREDG